MEQNILLNGDPFAVKAVTLGRREDALLKAGALKMLCKGYPRRLAMEIGPVCVSHWP
jgi:hypothetical protein